MANKLYPFGFGGIHGYSKAFSITPSDSTDLATNTNGLFVVNTGTQTLSLIFEGDTSSVSLGIVPTGVYAFAAKRVMSSGTTATVFGLV